MFASVRKVAAKYGPRVAPAALALPFAAHAEVPAAVTTAITGAGTDLVTAGVAVISAMVGVWGIIKLGKKFGWS